MSFASFANTGGGHGAGPYPPAPDRWSLMTKTWHFQGLRVPIDGLFGWFEPALAWIDKAKRPAVYAVKDAVGDEIYGLSLSGAYNEAGQPYDQYSGYDFSSDMSGLNALIDEIVTGGNGKRVVRLFCAGDGQGSGPGYNDPVGKTYGHDWLMNFFPTVVKSLGDRYRYVQFYPGYDSIFYGWDPWQVEEFGSLVRSLLPDCVLGLEHNIGHIPTGEGEDSYLPGGTMEGYDIVSSEYDGQDGDSQCLVHNDAVWQINDRLSRPLNRPADMPAGDDPNPPFYLLDSPRGPRIHEMLEWATYYDVRGGCTPEAIQNDRNYLKAMSPSALVA